MQLQQAVNDIFVEPSCSFERLSGDQYVQPCTLLKHNKLGQQVRHIIKLFQFPELGYIKGNIHNDERKRDHSIETDKELAGKLMPGVCIKLDKPNKHLRLEAGYDEHSNEQLVIPSNHYREMAYNLEHGLHRMAVTRIGISEVSRLSLSENFCVASSIIKSHGQCAQ